MNIVYGANDAYAEYLGTSLLSLLSNNKTLQTISVYILDNGISARNRKLLEAICSFHRRTVCFIDTSHFEDIIGFPVRTAGFNPVILARLFLTRYIPDTIDKILYLDCDTIVAQSLECLDTLDLDRYYFAAVPELYMPSGRIKRLGLDRDAVYYNSGVMLINLRLWRVDRLAEYFMKYYEKMQDALLYADQDILNYCCRNRILTLSHSYNLSPNLYYFPRFFIRRLQPAYYMHSREEYLAILKNPCIIHYLGDERPWIHGNKNVYRDYYERYHSLSPWKDTSPVYGREAYMKCYHILNVITKFCPWFRILFSNIIGINKFKWFRKK